MYFYNLKVIILLFVLLSTGCSLTSNPDFLTQTRNQLLELQKNEDVKVYAASEMKQAEDTVIAAVNAWNDGQRSDSQKLSEKAVKEIDQAYKVAKGQASLGLTKKAWEQRRFLQEQRRARMKSQ